jgi:hypothetical protein
MFSEDIVSPPPPQNLLANNNFSRVPFGKKPPLISKKIHVKVPTQNGTMTVEGQKVIRLAESPDTMLKQ